MVRVKGGTKNLIDAAKIIPDESNDHCIERIFARWQRDRILTEKDCPQCGKKMYFRMADQTVWCDECGYQWGKLLFKRDGGKTNNLIRKEINENLKEVREPLTNRIRKVTNECGSGGQESV